MDYIPLVDEDDKLILMHRDAHFGGSFEVMLEYYQAEGKGAQAEFDPDRIEQLAAIERQIDGNLAAEVLDGADAEVVCAVRELYEELKSLYEDERDTDTIPVLIADLILSEGEDAEGELQALASKGEKAVPALIDLLQAERLANPLFPGYGWGPVLAARCLGRISSPKAIIPLFESIGHSNGWVEEAAIAALGAIGEPARDFLLQIIKGEFITLDTERAAIALGPFEKDPLVQEAAAQLLKRVDSIQEPILAEYLRLLAPASL